MDLHSRHTLGKHRKVHRDHIGDLCVAACGLMVRHHDDRISVGRNLDSAEADAVSDDVAAVFMLDHIAFHAAAHAVILVGDRVGAV